MSDHSIGVSLAKEHLPLTNLSFPGKICMDNEGKRLAVADTGHHRILVINKEGIVLKAIGGGEKNEAGNADGTFSEARFHSPQGIVFENEVIFVADTENHTIRQVQYRGNLKLLHVYAVLENRYIVQYTTCIFSSEGVCSSPSPLCLKKFSTLWLCINFIIKSSPPL